MRRIIIPSVMAVTVVAAAMAVMAMTAGEARGATPPTAAVITFDDGARQATLQIPDPACDATEPNCVWKFFLNEPKTSVDVAIVYSPPGPQIVTHTLSIRYPDGFCGIIQADAYVGPSEQGPWVSKRGWQHQIADNGSCVPEPPSSPEPTPSPPAGTSTPPSPTQTDSPTGTEPSPVVAAATAQPTTTTATTVPPHVSTAAAVSSLPFTGVDLPPIILLGTILLALGLCLQIGSRRRTY